MMPLNQKEDWMRTKKNEKTVRESIWRLVCRLHLFFDQIKAQPKRVGHGLYRR